MSALPFTTDPTPPTGPRDDHDHGPADVIHSPHRTRLHRPPAYPCGVEHIPGVTREQSMHSWNYATQRAIPLERVTCTACIAAVEAHSEACARVREGRGAMTPLELAAFNATTCACGRVSQRADEPCNACVEDGR